MQTGFRLAQRQMYQRVYAIDEDMELSDELIEKITSHFPIESYICAEPDDGEGER